ncbi:MAG: TlpA family protein disulfide reductase [Verrucomicrobia bacterium]|nr:TlpA family protein disulfide reductase [Verrucomicrobiota bacterium]
MTTRFFRFVLLAAAVAAVSLVASINKGHSVQDAETAPAWTATGIDGKAVSSSDFAGKVVILTFWATWCPPCRAEIPGFIDLQKQHAKEGLVIVGASVDQGGTDAVEPFVEKTAINYPVVLASEEMQEAFGGIEGIPATFIIDRAGKIVSKHVGFVEKKQLEKEIKPLLSAEK